MRPRSGSRSIVPSRSTSRLRCRSSCSADQLFVFFFLRSLPRVSAALLTSPPLSSPPLLPLELVSTSFFSFSNFAKKTLASSWVIVVSGAALAERRRSVSCASPPLSWAALLLLPAVPLLLLLDSFRCGASPAPVTLLPPGRLLFSIPATGDSEPDSTPRGGDVAARFLPLRPPFPRRQRFLFLCPLPRLRSGMWNERNHEALQKGKSSRKRPNFVSCDVERHAGVPGERAHLLASQAKDQYPGRNVSLPAKLRVLKMR